MPAKLGFISKTWTTANALTTDFDNFESNTLSYVVADTSVGSEQARPNGIGAVYYYLTDGLGSVRDLIDSSGNVVVSYDYDAFGAIRSITGTLANDFRFTGEQWDADAGLYYLRARYYDPSTGRFVSKDPWPGRTGDPSTLNRYPYVLNNPVRYTDPTGRCIEDACVLEVTLVATAPVWVPVVQAAALAAGTAALAFVVQNADAIGNGIATSCQNAANGLQQVFDKAFPRNPDDWVPPPGVREEPKASENTGGRYRHWFDEAGKLVRQWHKGKPGASGWKGKDHWHDETLSDPDNHVLPEEED